MAKVTTSVTSVKSTPIYGMLTKSSKELVGRRGEMAAIGIQEASEEIVRTLQKKVRALEIRILDLEDFGPDSSLSLRPVSKDFNPTDWVKQIHQANLELELLQRELSIAEKTHAKYCGE